MDLREDRFYESDVPRIGEQVQFYEVVWEVRNIRRVYNLRREHVDINVYLLRV